MKKSKKEKPSLKPSINVDEDLKRLVAVVVITNQGLKETYQKKFINEANVNYLVVFNAKDLNYKPNVIFETQMYDSSQEVYFILCQNARVHQIMEIVQEQCQLLLESRAQVFSIPLSSMINYNLFQFLIAK